MIEVVIVVVLMGVLAGAVAFGVGSVASGASDGPCVVDRRTLGGASAIYLSQDGVSSIPAANASVDGYEQTLVDADLLESTSQLHDLDSAGTITVAASSPC